MLPQAAATWSTSDLLLSLVNFTPFPHSEHFLCYYQQPQSASSHACFSIWHCCCATPSSRKMVHLTTCYQSGHFDLLPPATAKRPTSQRAILVAILALLMPVQPQNCPPRTFAFNLAMLLCCHRYRQIVDFASHKCISGPPSGPHRGEKCDTV